MVNGDNKQAHWCLARNTDKVHSTHAQPETSCSLAQPDMNTHMTAVASVVASVLHTQVVASSQLIASFQRHKDCQKNTSSKPTHMSHTRSHVRRRSAAAAELSHLRRPAPVLLARRSSTLDSQGSEPVLCYNKTQAAQQVRHHSKPAQRQARSSSTWPAFASLLSTPPR